jgi:hypothetical protein
VRVEVSGPYVAGSFAALLRNLADDPHAMVVERLEIGDTEAARYRLSLLFPVDVVPERAHVTSPAALALIFAVLTAFLVGYRAPGAPAEPLGLSRFPRTAASGLLVRPNDATLAALDDFQVELVAHGRRSAPSSRRGPGRSDPRPRGQPPAASAASAA